MTTIAWDGQTLAADTLTTWGSTRDGDLTKIIRKGPILAGVSGAVAPSLRFLDWIRSGLEGDPPEMPGNEHTTHGVIILQDGQIATYGPLGWERVRASQYALGSGAEFAQGAMAMGADARRAVEVAAQFDIKTGGEVTVLRRERPTEADVMSSLLAVRMMLNRSAAPLTEVDP